MRILANLNIFVDFAHEEFYSHCNDFDFIPILSSIRTRQSYNDAVKKLRESGAPNKGIKRESEFNILKHYHVADPGLPPCFAHDFQEGAASFDLFLLINNLKKNGLLMKN